MQVEYNWTGLNVNLLAASALLFWIGVILVSSAESRRSSCTLHKMKVVRQVVFTDVLIAGWLNVDGQSFAPIGLHKIDAASDWLLMKGLPGVQLQN